MRAKGFTLIELILYVGLMAIMISTVVILLSFLLQTRVKSEATLAVEDEGFFALTTIINTATRAQAITIPAVGNDDASLKLSMPDPAENPTVFNLVGGILEERIGNGASKPLTTSRTVISDLIFSNRSNTATPGLLSIHFVTSAVNPNGRNEFTYSAPFAGAISLR